ncbi:MAG: hypothetical protein ABII12_06595, partial [Planctomycetota bacterium]
MNRRVLAAVNVATLTGMVFLFAGCAANQQPPCRESAVERPVDGAGARGPCESGRPTQTARDAAAKPGEDRSAGKPGEDRSFATRGDRACASRSRPDRTRRCRGEVERPFGLYRSGTWTGLREIDIHKVSGECQ